MVQSLSVRNVRAHLSKRISLWYLISSAEVQLRALANSSSSRWSVEYSEPLYMQIRHYTHTGMVVEVGACLNIRTYLTEDLFLPSEYVGFSIYNK